MKQRIFFIPVCWILLFCSEINAQAIKKISGTIIEALNGTPVIAAHCTDLKSGASAITDENGYFVLQTKKDTVQLQITHVAFETYNLLLTGNLNKHLTIKLDEKTLSEISVIASEPLHKQTLSGRTTIPVKRIQAIPAFLGEPDLLKALAFIPGISISNKGISNMYVRGGSRQNNLVLMDDAPMYGSGHMLGFLSPYNTDVLKNIDIYKGGFPARFGGRTASVLDLRIKEADFSKFNGMLDIGILKSRLKLEFPILRQKSSLMLAARGTYTNFILAPFHNTEFMLPNYYFYDFNAKYTHKLSEKSKLTLNWYSNFDKFSLWQQSSNDSKENISLNQQNHLVSLLNTTQIGANLILSVSANYSHFFTNRTVEVRALEPKDSLMANASLNSTRINDYSLNVKLKYSSNKHTIQAGLLPKIYSVQPWVLSNNNLPYLEMLNTQTQKSKPTTAFEFAFFAEDDWHVTPKLSVNTGLRISYFANGNTNYLVPEPRLALRYAVTDAISLKTGLNTMSQFLHVMESNASGLTSEVWLLSDSLFVPQKANQLSAGIFSKFAGFEWGIEAYAKEIKNLVFFEYMNYESLHTDWRSDIHRNGTGKSLGLEFSVQKQSEKLFFAMAYTLSKTTYGFEKVNFGKSFAAPFDKLHDFNIFVNYKPNAKHEFGISWVYNTGTPITLPAGNITNSGIFGSYYGYNGINGQRLPDYHRLDISWKKTKKLKRGGEKYWAYSLYNAYSRKNPIIISMRPGGKVEKRSLLPIVPSINWGIRF